MPWLNYKNNAIGTLIVNVADDATSIGLDAGQGASFPSSNFKISINNEILLCSSRSSDTLTVQRGQEGTAPAAHALGDAVQLRLTSGGIEEIQDAVDGDIANLASHEAATDAHGASGAVVGTNNTQTLTDKTLTTPTIASFVNAQHTHESAAQGGVITTVPTGAVLPYASATPPSGYLLCNGSAVNRVTYAALFAIIGITYGAGDGSTTFNLPDLGGNVVVGYKASDPDYSLVNIKSGAKTANLAHTHTVNSHTHTGPSHQHLHSHNHSVNITTSGEWNNWGQSSNTNNQVGYGPPAHNHSVSGWSSDAANGPYGAYTSPEGTGATGSSAPSTSSAGSGSQDIRQPYITLGYIIKC